MGEEKEEEKMNESMVLIGFGDTKSSHRKGIGKNEHKKVRKKERN